MSESEKKPSVTEREAQLSQRDAETQIALGAFVTVLAVPVLIGTHWASTTPQMVVNLLAGLVLLGIGVIVFSLGLFKKLRQ
ncbi:MAG TPA: hypothetical protein PLO37_25785 [Candidatus Hydrogenedentes bacterium]|nr:hypothetical protein [Candidatus Hydrogenedentota bacterium]HPG70268.1 hypothetical protein [Candidatus Hydrogenedentota bacterium]